MGFAQRLKEKRAKIEQQGGRGKKPYKFRAGKTEFVILPDPSDPNDIDLVSRSFSQMWIKDIQGKVKAVTVCKKNTFDEDDGVRDLLWAAINAAKEMNSKKLEDFYKDMLGSHQSILNISVLNDDNQSPDEPVFIHVSDSQLDQMLGAYESRLDDLDEDEAEEYNPLNLKAMQVLRVEKKGSGMDTEYTYTASTKTHKLGKDVMSKVMDLDEYIQGELASSDPAKAVAAIAATNEVAGIEVDLPGELLGSGGTENRKALPAGTGSSETVADATDEDDVEDGEYEEEVVDDEDQPPFETEDDADEGEDEDEDEDAEVAAAEAALAKKKKAAAAKKRKAAAAKKKAAEDAKADDGDDEGEDAGSSDSDSDEIDDILNGLD